MKTNNKINLLLILLLILFSMLIMTVDAQDIKIRQRDLPKNYYPATIIDGDTVAIVKLRRVIVYPKLIFKNNKERQAYYKLIRDVKKTLPYAQLVYETLIETYEYIETLPNDKERQKHLKKMEKELYKEYKPELKKLTYSQGKILLKLIDRQCNQSSYALVKAYLGPLRAGFWNFFAGFFGASLKTNYDPKGKDKMLERVATLVENNLI